MHLWRNEFVLFFSDKDEGKQAQTGEKYILDDKHEQNGMPYFTRDNSILCISAEFPKKNHFLNQMDVNTVAMFQLISLSFIYMMSNFP